MSGVKRYSRNGKGMHASNVGAFVKIEDYDALAQQLAASEARAIVNAEDCNEAERSRDIWKEYAIEKVKELTARDKQLAEAVGLLHRWLDMFEGGIKSGDLNKLWNATADYVDPTAIEQDKAND